MSSSSQTSRNEWTPESWKTKPIVQDVTYEDQEHAKRVLSKLDRLPPLVSAKEVLIDNLRQQLKEVALGNSFLLQGGDCAELFDYCSQDPIEAKLKVLLQMSLVLTWGARTSVVRIARMAGQYAKPRSKPTEMYEGKEILSFRGDNVNGFDPKDRDADPERLLGAYFHSAATLNYVRSLLDSGFADLHDPSNWNLNHVRSESVRSEYQQIVTQLTDALDFMGTIGADSRQQNNNALNSVDFFVSHEALLLDFEASLTRLLPCTIPSADNKAKKEKKWYNAGAHFLWIGDRTRQPDGAHVEYMRGIENPIGIKVGPTTKPDELVELLNTVNPDKHIGKVTLITRFGAGQVEKHLPQHIKAVKKSGHIPVWVCDPMHGNTKNATGGIKTRHFIDIIQELSEAFRVHKDNNSKLNGVHFELTGDSVTECIGGSMDLKDADLSTNYQTYCDPRLNYEQALDVAFLIGKYYQKERRGQVFPSL
ncbi:hypothetical protein PHYBLDRAFT_113606 [Phycomyces blakesleeanus NRRL 1555(-)]|uniref:Phospho-2-dehydro-3-deoxyheptonate aldolase n=1 Tax=Phycomyces blakesleeanus (strain ATCC 8743b / DSM 1359 / FGSC 10004 / NBRC 33097 / NRRL 1555) TaxID=763407 RepID=A0A167ME74_PHYB8|nr:hypothetical protein PHYBLDRAFT_113606 [Phycomyces blakesleeanus NRRL 1555(-)]OAD72596.1 hypothetical protein PHYBLDRAFT_113606 [Phycomyces blakesleeanus NRRL 1555(-)]|eukprot:XP_018290636.1 hypothetical protein PHYBLDRAFT_113606 [Phycomyces blakesleeanus NRRL 1555(-)]